MRFASVAESALRAVKMGAHAAAYALDTGQCVFCGEGGAHHEDHCDLHGLTGDQIRAIAALDSEET